MENSILKQFAEELKPNYEAVIVLNDKVIMAYDFNESTGSNYSMFVNCKYVKTLKTLSDARDFASSYKE